MTLEKENSSDDDIYNISRLLNEFLVRLDTAQYEYPNSDDWMEVMRGGIPLEQYVNEARFELMALMYKMGRKG